MCQLFQMICKFVCRFFYTSLLRSFIIVIITTTILLFIFYIFFLLFSFLYLYFFLAPFRRWLLIKQAHLLILFNINGGKGLIWRKGFSMMGERIFWHWYKEKEKKVIKSRHFYIYPANKKEKGLDEEWNKSRRKGNTQLISLLYKEKDCCKLTHFTLYRYTYIRNWCLFS